DEAAERMGVDVMRWLFAKARPEENINFGWHAADEARRELLVLWNVYAFFVTYARLAGWQPDPAGAIDPPTGGTVLDRWIRSRPTSTTFRPGTCGCPGGGSHGTPMPGTERLPSGPSITPCCP